MLRSGQARSDAHFASFNLIPRQILRRSARLPVMAGVAALVLLRPADAEAQTCEPDHQEVQYRSGAAKLRNYMCEQPNGTRIRITFLRLGETLAGGLLMGEPPYELRKITGPVQLIENEVSAEARYLFENFSSSQIENVAPDADPGFSAFTLDIQTPPTKGTGTKSASGSGVARPETQKVWYLTDQDTIRGGPAVYIKKPHVEFMDAKGWPRGFNAYYNCDASTFLNQPLTCSSIWRYLKIADLETVARETEEWEKETEAQIRAEIEKEALSNGSATGIDEVVEPDTGTPEQEYDFPSYKKHFPMFRQLSKRGWPEDFVVLEGHPELCGGQFSFQYFPRPLLTDVVLVENLSGEPISIDDMLGARASSEAFRSVADSNALKGTSPSELSMPSRSVPAGGKIAIATRMMFDNGLGQQVGEGGPWGAQSDANAVWSRIKSMPAKAVLEEPLDVDGIEKTFRKYKEAYKPPSLPRRAQYVYGPEVQISGMIIDGTTLMFEGTSANYLEFTSAADGGSCPFLYSWNEEHGDWLSHGKVIDEAREKANERTELAAVPNGVMRFKIAEEEPEVSYLDAISLRVTMKDGRQIALDVQGDRTLKTIDRIYKVLPAYTTQVFSFVWPTALERGDVLKSELAITGFYRRYSAMTATALAGTN
jgi:hypothetical protein